MVKPSGRHDAALVITAPALVVATRAAVRRDGPVAAVHHSPDKVAAEAKYSGLRAQLTDRTGAANVALRRRRPSAAKAPELFQLYEGEPRGGPPAPLPEVAGPQDRVRRCFVEQIIESFVLVQILDVPVASAGLARPNLTPAFDQTLMDDTEQVIEVPKISCPPSFLPSRMLPFQLLAVVVCWMVEVFQVLSQDRVLQRLFVEVLKGLFPNRVQQRLVWLILVWVVKALSQNRIQQRLVVLFTTTSSQRTRRKGWRRKKCWERCSMSPSTASNTPPSAPDASAATSWLGAAVEDGAARWHEQGLHPLFPSLEQTTNLPAPVSRRCPGSTGIGFLWETLSKYFGLVRQRMQFMRQFSEASVL